MEVCSILLIDISFVTTGLDRHEVLGWSNIVTF